MAADDVRKRFIDDTSEHVMSVLRDDGLYRHLRFQKPGTSSYYYDLVTWPGYLAVVGDCGDFVFSRTRDMFEFFRPQGARDALAGNHGINPQYWSEKLQAPLPDGALRFSDKAFEQHVGEWFDSVSSDLSPTEIAALHYALVEQVLVNPTSDHEAHVLLQEFEHEGIRIADAWEWDLREYDFRFLWCCWAIVWGISRYDAARSADIAPAGRLAHRRRLARFLRVPHRLGRVGARLTSLLLTPPENCYPRQGDADYHRPVPIAWNLYRCTTCAARREPERWWHRLGWRLTFGHYNPFGRST